MYRVRHEKSGHAFIAIFPPCFVSGDLPVSTPYYPSRCQGRMRWSYMGRVVQWCGAAVGMAELLIYPLLTDAAPKHRPVFACFHDDGWCNSILVYSSYACHWKEASLQLSLHIPLLECKSCCSRPYAVLFQVDAPNTTLSCPTR